MGLNLVPQPGNGPNLQNTQNPILQNFTNIDANFAVDHQAYNSGPSSGFHNKLTMPQQSSVPAGIASTNLIYSALSALSSVNELFINKNNGGAIPLTAALKALPGYTYLPSGIILKWGQSSPVAGVVTFPVAGNIPVFASCFAVLTTPTTPVLGASVQAITPTTFTVSGTGFSMYWLAIGV